MWGREPNSPYGTLELRQNVLNHERLQRLTVLLGAEENRGQAPACVPEHKQRTSTNQRENAAAKKPHFRRDASTYERLRGGGKKKNATTPDTAAAVGRRA